VRDALLHGEAAPPEFAGWTHHECLRRLRMRWGLRRKELAAKAGVSASLVGRAEKGADVRLSTLRRLYAALGCRLLILPAGASYDLDWRDAHLDDEWLDWKRANARYLGGVSVDSTVAGNSEISGNAIPLTPEPLKESETHTSQRGFRAKVAAKHGMRSEIALTPGSQESS
jgi:transcriptional regulator with XRE-family HTH domain